MKKREASKIFICITNFLDAIGIGIIIPILPDVIKRFGATPDFVSTYFGYFISIYAFMQFIASPMLGALADKYGRRPVLLLSLLGGGLDYLLMAFAPSLSILFIGRIISGLSGANMTVASSYMADISTNEDRAANFGLIGASFGIGFVVGPVLGGVMGQFGHEWPFIAASFLTLLNFLFGIFILPESLPIEKRREIKWTDLNPFKSLLKILRNKALKLFFIIFFLSSLAGQVHPSMWTLYTAYKFHWNAFQIGLSLSAVGVAVGIGQGVMTGHYTRKFGEESAVKWGTIVATISYFLYGVANQTWMIYAIISMIILATISPPALQSMMSREVEDREQGELQGSLVSIMSLTSIIGPILYTNLFSYYTATNTVQVAGAPYFLAALISLICLLLIFYKTTFKVKV